MQLAFNILGTEVFSVHLGEPTFVIEAEDQEPGELELRKLPYGFTGAGEYPGGIHGEVEEESDQDKQR